jgi:hypothetical protein
MKLQTFLLQLLFCLLLLFCSIESTQAQTKKETQEWIVQKLNAAIKWQEYWNPEVYGEQTWWHWRRNPLEFKIINDILEFKIENKYTNESLISPGAASALRDNYYCTCEICKKHKAQPSSVTYVTIPLSAIVSLDYNYGDLSTYGWKYSGSNNVNPEIDRHFIIKCRSSAVNVSGDLSGYKSKERVFNWYSTSTTLIDFRLPMDDDVEENIYARLVKAFNHLQTFYPRNNEIF